MNWVRDKIRNWLFRDPTPQMNVKCSANEPLDRPRAIRFSITKANGGYVVDTSSYDRRSDTLNQETYVIADSDDLGEHIKTIVVREALKG